MADKAVSILGVELETALFRRLCKLVVEGVFPIYAIDVQLTWAVTDSSCYLFLRIVLACSYAKYSEDGLCGD